MLDDLDETQDSSGSLAMPATQRLLRDRGVTFANHFVSTPICCPSRVNFLCGRLSHNTNFTDVLGPHGGYAKFRALGLDKEWLPTWLQRGGYNTLYTGKFIVDYTMLNRDPPPAGWTEFDALVHPFTFEYYNPAFSLNGGEPNVYPAQYNTDVVAAKALALLQSAAADKAGKPFYLQVAPPAPHHSMHYEYDSKGSFMSRHWFPPVPAARHWDSLSEAVLPKPLSFNDTLVYGKPAWLRALPGLSSANVTFLEEIFRLRLRCMIAVDELVAALVNELDVLGLTNDTYILFTSDNGYHEGAHRMGSGKTTAYEEDIRVPLVMAGPGLTPGSRVQDTTQHVDIAPTVLALAGLPLPTSLDGTPLPLAKVSDGTLPANYIYGSKEQGPLRNQMIGEFWGSWQEESIRSLAPYHNLTWKAVRVLRSDHAEAYKYVLYCNGEYELYDLIRDPNERINLLVPVGIGGLAATAGRTGWWSTTREAITRIRHLLSSGSGSPTIASDQAESAEEAAASSSLHGGTASVVVAAAKAWARSAWAVRRRDKRPGGRAGGGRGGAAAYGLGQSGTLDYPEWLWRIRSRLDALLAVLAVCSGRTCSRPFQVIHPDGRVADLWAAMDEQYDDLYDNIEPFSFVQCLPYQDVANEFSPFRDAVVPECSARPPGGSAVDGDAAGECAPASSADGDGISNSDGSGGGGDAFVYLQSDIESSAVPLPQKYRQVTDVYGITVETDSWLLA